MARGLRYYYPKRTLRKAGRRYVYEFSEKLIRSALGSDYKDPVDFFKSHNLTVKELRIPASCKYYARKKEQLKRKREEDEKKRQLALQANKERPVEEEKEEQPSDKTISMVFGQTNGTSSALAAGINEEPLSLICHESRNTTLVKANPSEKTIQWLNTNTDSGDDTPTETSPTEQHQAQPQEASTSVVEATDELHSLST